MKIDRIRVDSFGRLSGFDTGPEPVGSLVVVLGPNEAGKSTLFSFLTTALYGFQPASRERNPHVPWGADEASGSISITLAGAGCAEVERRLRSAPSGTLRLDGRARPLRNQPLPWVEHVPRTVFRQVFAVTLSELAGLDEETWARIQDRVLGSMGATDLRPPRSVADELEREAAEIWRPNRRGHQRLRALQEDVRALRAQRSDALSRDAQIRALIEEGENLEVRLQEVRAERQRDRNEVERIQELNPLKKQFDRIAELRSEGGPRHEIAGLPDDPMARFDALESEARQLGRQLEAIDRALVGPREAVSSFEDADRTLLAREDEISAFLRRAAPVEVDRTRLSALRDEVVDLEYRAKTAADHLLVGAFDQNAQDAISALSVDLLRDRVRRLSALDEESTGTTGLKPSGPVPHLAQSGALILASSGMGAGLMLWSVLGGPPILLTLGAALFAAGLTLLLIRLLSGERGRAASSITLEDGAPELENEIFELLGPVSIRAEYLTPPSDPLVAGVERLQALSREWHERARAQRSSEESMSSMEAAARSLGTSLGYADPVDVTSLSARLDRDVREAERRRDAAAKARADIGGLEREREIIAGERSEVDGRLESLRMQVARLGDGSAEAGLEFAQRRVEAHRRADRMEAELNRSYPDLAALRARVEAIEPHGSADGGRNGDLAVLKARIEEFDRQIDELASRSGAIEREAAHLREKETVDAVDGEVATLQQDEARLIEERDRKWIIAQLLREADRRFREEHQPDLLRRASSYLEHLTDGRYDRLLVDEQNDRDLFQLVGPGIPAPVALARPISTGTLEQAYLSLRLAIVDHLDQGNERLPLFIDEALVNWDAERRSRGLEVLASLAATRQVFAFTCHPEMAEQLESRGGRIIHLDRDS